MIDDIGAFASRSEGVAAIQVATYQLRCNISKKKLRPIQVPHDANDLIASVQKRSNQVGSDKTGCAGYKCSHSGRS